MTTSIGIIASKVNGAVLPPGIPPDIIPIDISLLINVLSTVNVASYTVNTWENGGITFYPLNTAGVNMVANMQATQNNLALFGGIYPVTVYAYYTYGGNARNYRRLSTGHETKTAENFDGSGLLTAVTSFAARFNSCQFNMIQTITGSGQTIGPMSLAFAGFTI